MSSVCSQQSKSTEMRASCGFIPPQPKLWKQWVQVWPSATLTSPQGCRELASEWFGELAARKPPG